ncbi:MAG: GGDEF domain-containing protein [Magnetococcales bacterium]|nr:GGDEF domain-containing protein [Magnetococcales bacterium]
MIINKTSSSSITHQLVARVGFSVFSVLILIAILIILIQENAMNSDADTNLKRLADYYSEQINLWEQEWQSRAIEIHVYLEMFHAFDDTENMWKKVRQFLVASEESSPFRAIVITGTNGKILFNYKADSYFFSEQWNLNENSTKWLYDKKSFVLFRSYTQPIMIGNNGIGLIHFFRAIDNSLLYKHHFPDSDLSIVWDGQVVASSLGSVAIGKPPPREGKYWQGGERYNIRHNDWEKMPGSPVLVLHLRTHPILSKVDIVAIVFVSFGVFFLLLIPSVGVWLFATIRRLLCLEKASREFSSRAILSKTILQNLIGAHGKNKDEIRNVADSIKDLMESVVESSSSFERSLASRIAISALLETSIEPISMSRQMDIALEIILSVPWLSIQFKGSIFTIDEGGDTLILQASKGFHESLIIQCSRIPLGHCLCGLAAQSRQAVFTNHLDERHSVRFSGIEEHGHYCLPILSKSQLLGVLNCYIPANSHYQPEEEAFLTTVANTLAGIIERRQLESQLAKAREQLSYAATHDSMTGLPNKSLFLEHFNQSLAIARREKNMMALLFIDLDRFKFVNDTFGHDVGDMLLVEVSQRLKSILRSSDLVARLGGDEFAAVLNDIVSQDDAIHVSNKILYFMQLPFHLKQHECHIGSSIGISIFPEHGDNADILIKNADLAMYAVKKSGRNSFSIFDEHQHSVVSL